MPEKRKCDGCGKEYWWPGGRWQHTGCKDSLVGDVVREPGYGGGVGIGDEVHPDKGLEEVVISVGRKRGRPRIIKDLRKYRREYMRGYRARKRG